jgi:hypothetical protein
MVLPVVDSCVCVFRRGKNYNALLTALCQRGNGMPGIDDEILQRSAAKLAVARSQADRQRASPTPISRGDK